MYYLLIFVLILFSAFFSASEIAYTSVNGLRLEKMAEEGKKFGAKRALAIHENFISALSGILIGNNIVNIYASSIATVIAIDLAGGTDGLAITIATAAVTVIIITFGEVMPKCIGKRFSLWLVRFASYPLTVIVTLLKPICTPFVLFVRLLEKMWNKNPEAAVTEDVIESLIDTAEEENIIDEDKSDLLKSALDFSDMTVEEVLTHRVRMTAIDVLDDYEENCKKVISSIYSRIPVYREDSDHIIGILQVNAFLTEIAEGNKPKFEDYMAEPCFMHKTTKLDCALKEMQDEKMHLAVVVDEYGGTMGIVTMEDILEEIVGDIWDENEEIALGITETSDNTYEVMGDVGIWDFFEYIDFDDRDFESDYTTVGGWAVEMLEEDPHEGDSFTYKNLYVLVVSMGENIINTLSVTVNETEEGD